MNAHDIDLATEIWAAAQRGPGEGVEDAIERIAQIIEANRKRRGEPVACFKCGHAKHVGECVNVAPQPADQLAAAVAAERERAATVVDEKIGAVRKANPGSDGGINSAVGFVLYALGSCADAIRAGAKGEPS